MKTIALFSSRLKLLGRGVPAEPRAGRTGLNVRPFIVFAELPYPALPTAQFESLQVSI